MKFVFNGQLSRHFLLYQFGCARKSILEPTSLLTFINDLHDYISSHVFIYTDHTNIYLFLNGMFDRFDKFEFISKMTFNLSLTETRSASLVLKSPKRNFSLVIAIKNLCLPSISMADAKLHESDTLHLFRLILFNYYVCCHESCFTVLCYTHLLSIIYLTHREVYNSSTYIY